MEAVSASRTASRTAVFHRSFFAMNTRFSMVLVGIDAEQADALAAAAERELRVQERTMSRFDTHGPLADLNRRAAKEAVEPPQELWEILLLCRDDWERTAGAFDITLWPLSHLWREHLERGEEPAEETLAQARQHTGMAHVHFDEAAHTVRFESQEMSIDLGGFGKGFALERLAGSLRAQGVEQAFLSFGESSIAVLGSHPHGPAWPVGIADMFHPSRTMHTFHLKNASLSSSGTAPFNRMAERRAVGQIIDPRSGRPIEGYRTMSVASPSATEAEVLSTALLVTPEPERAALLSCFSLVSAVEIVYQPHEGDFIPRIDWCYEL